MSTVKRIVCLANSRKLSGRCVAGIEFTKDRAGAWIRPVSDREHGEVSAYERRYENGDDPQVLDIMDVPLRDPVPKGYQQENWLLDPGTYWVRVDRASWNHLGRLVGPLEPLWINGYSTYDGFNDKVPLSQANSLTGSLRLVHADSMRFSIMVRHLAMQSAVYRVNFVITELNTISG